MSLTLVFIHVPSPPLLELELLKTGADTILPAAFLTGPYFILVDCLLPVVPAGVVNSLTN